jgi:hypothetical protein
MVFMAFLGEKLFAFLFFSGAVRHPSGPLLLIKKHSSLSRCHLIAGRKEDRSDA